MEERAAKRVALNPVDCKHDLPVPSSAATLPSDIDCALGQDLAKDSSCAVARPGDKYEKWGGLPWIIASAEDFEAACAQDMGIAEMFRKLDYLDEHCDDSIINVAAAVGSTFHDACEVCRINSPLLDGLWKVTTGFDPESDMPFHADIQTGTSHILLRLLYPKPYLGTMQLLCERIGLRRSNSASAIATAAAAGLDEVLSFLLSWTADVQHHPSLIQKACERACQNGHLRCLELLMPVIELRKPLYSAHMLSYAVVNGHADIVRFLLSIDGLVPASDAVNAVFWAIESCDVAMVELFLPYAPDTRLLQLAILRTYNTAMEKCEVPVDILRAFLHRSLEDFDCVLDDTLSLAIRGGRVDHVTLLLQHLKADTWPELRRQKVLNMAENSHFVSLSLVQALQSANMFAGMNLDVLFISAVISRDVAAARLLLELEANVSQQLDLALCVACAGLDQPMADLLREVRRRKFPLEISFPSVELTHLFQHLVSRCTVTDESHLTILSKAACRARNFDVLYALLPTNPRCVRVSAPDLYEAQSEEALRLLLHCRVRSLPTLCAAARLGNIDLINELLTELGNFSPSDFAQALLEAVKAGHAAATAWLLEQSFQYRVSQAALFSALFMAAVCGFADVYAAVYAHMATLLVSNTFSALGDLLREANSPNPLLRIVQVLLEYFDNEPLVSDDDALCLACASGHHAVAQLFLQKGANVQYKSNEPLWLSQEGGHDAVAQLLLSLGVRCRSRARIMPADSTDVRMGLAAAS